MTFSRAGGGESGPGHAHDVSGPAGPDGIGDWNPAWGSRPAPQTSTSCGHNTPYGCGHVVPSGHGHIVLDMLGPGNHVLFCETHCPCVTGVPKVRRCA